MLDWKGRAIAATRGRQLGAVLACALDVDIGNPRYVGKASVTSDEFVMCSFVGKDDQYHQGAFVGAQSDLIRNCAGLADHLTLDGTERTELADTVCGWLAQDYSNLAHRKLRAAVEKAPATA